MKKSELHKLIGEVRVRHNRRVLWLMTLVFGVLIIGLMLMPGISANVASSPDALFQRRLYLYVLVTLVCVIVLVGLSVILKCLQLDVAKFQVVCPQCNQSLYPVRRLLLGGRSVKETEVCPHCRHRLIDEA